MEAGGSGIQGHPSLHSELFQKENETKPVVSWIFVTCLLIFCPFTGVSFCSPWLAAILLKLLPEQSKEKVILKRALDAGRAA